MTTDMVVSEQIKTEANPSEDRKACTATPQPDEKVRYVAPAYPEKHHDMVQDQIVMVTSEQVAADMGMYDGLTMMPQHATHMQAHPTGHSPYYQLVPPSQAYCNSTQQLHYGTTTVQAAYQHADPGRAQLMQPFAAPTVMYVPMSYYQQEAQPAMRQQPAMANMAPAGVTYHQMPVEYATQQVASMPTQHPGSVSSPATATMAPSVNYRTGHRQRVVIWNYCQFCQNNKEPEEFYRNHTLRDASGRILCPVLRAYNCPLCNNGGGDKAHTKSYCPQLRNRHPVNAPPCQSNRRHSNLHGGHQQPKLKGHSQQFQNGSSAEMEHITA